MAEAVLAIFGPTASGKTAVAEAIAHQIPAEVISADAAALFRGLEVLTAAPEYSARLVGVFDVEHEVSVAEFQRLAHEAIDDVLGSGRTPVLVGGTGLYFRAALSDLELPPPPAEGAREQWEAFYDTHGGIQAHARLQALDPEAAARVHPNDRRRVVRALELAEAGSSLAGDALWGGDTRRPTVVFGLDAPDGVLEQRIRARAAAMLERGVVEEARAALARPLSRSARKVMGLLDFAQLPSDEAREALVANNRRLARYQRKWMRRIPGLIALDANRAPDEIAADILGIARSRGMLGRVIRQVRTEDWERLRDVRLRALASDPGAFLETHADASTLPDERWQERATPDGTHSSFVLEQDDRFDGLVSCFFGDDPATAFLVAMWVAPELRGTGGARGLVERVIEWAREHRAGRVCLSVEPDNPRAARLYEKCGFVETDDPPTFPYQPNEDNRFFIFEL